MGSTGVTKGGEHDRHHAVIDGVVVGQHRIAHPIREGRRIGPCPERDRAEVLAGRPENIPDRAVAVVHTVDDRLGKVQEPPHQIQREVGASGCDAINDHRPLQVQVAHKVPLFLPIDKGPSRPERGDALADLGGDAVVAFLGCEFQAQATLDRRILIRKPDQNGGQALRPQCSQVVPGDGLLGRHAESGSRGFWTVSGAGVVDDVKGVAIAEIDLW